MSACNECRGRGEITCLHCYGSGRHGSDAQKACAYCHGTKKMKCPECNGSGKKT